MHRRRRSLLAAVLFCAAAFFLPAAAATETDAPTPEACAEFGRRIAEELNSQNERSLVPFFDAATLWHRCLKGIDANNRWEDMPYQQKILRNLLHVDAALMAEFVRILPVDGEHRVLLRLQGTQGGINYLALLVRAFPERGLLGIDCYDYASGQLLSATAHLTLVEIGAEKFNLPMTGAEARGEREKMRLLRKMGVHFSNGNYAAGMEIVSRFPDEVRLSKNVFRKRLNAAAQLPDEQPYLDTISEWEEVYPGDPALNLIAVHLHTRRRDYTKAAECIDHLARSIGGYDGYLSLWKAEQLALNIDRDGAKRALLVGIGAEPTLRPLYEKLMELCLTTYDYDLLAATLTQIEANFPYADMEASLKNRADYEGFRESEAYRRWLAGRSRREAAEETP